MYKLETIEKLEGTIVVETGLHIGAGDMEIHIGGTDNTVVKHPKTLEPYIPGSSMKGKMRSLLEHYLGLIQGANPVSLKDLQSNPNDKNILSILQLFGASAGDDTDKKEVTKHNLISRLSFSDCFISKESKDEMLTEIKAENYINRASGTAGAPRFIERVPRGIKFDFKLTIKKYEGDDENYLKKIIDLGLLLLELDGIGGNGSRGYGRIKFEDINFERKLSAYENLRN